MKLPKKLYIQLSGVTLGAIIFFIINSLIVAAGLPNLLKLFSALIIAIILAIPFWKKKVMEKRRLKKAIIREGK